MVTNCCVTVWVDAEVEMFKRRVFNGLMNESEMQQNRTRVYGYTIVETLVLRGAIWTEGEIDENLVIAAATEAQQ